jgi:hypothetical protein
MNKKRCNILELESFWSNRMCELVSDDRFDDSNALYLEFVVDNNEPEDFMFLEYLNGLS